jgi:hypothetical protein
MAVLLIEILAGPGFIHSRELTRMNADKNRKIFAADFR